MTTPIATLATSGHYWIAPMCLILLVALLVAVPAYALRNV